MGQIANQMLVEWCCKIAQRTKWKKGIPEKRSRKKNADRGNGRISEKADQSDGKREAD